MTQMDAGGASALGRIGATLARKADRLADLDALDRPAALFERVGRLLPRPVRRVLHGEPLGHPAHPLVVVVPLGAWTSAAVLDLLPGGARSARSLIALGVATASPSSLTGLADWLHLDREGRRVGVAHAGANVVAVSLAAASWVARAGSQRSPAGRILLGAALLAVGVSGYLGGHLTYRRGAGVERAAPSAPDQPSSAD